MAKPFEWECGFDRNYLLKKIREGRQTKNGKCSLAIGEPLFWLPVLETAIRAKSSARHLKSRCVEKAIFDASLKLNNPEDFIEHCNAAYVEFSGKPQKTYLVFATITYSGEKLFDQISDDTCEITWQPDDDDQIFRTMCKERERLEPRLPQNIIPLPDDHLTTLLVRVQALDPGHAYAIATDAVDRLRGLLDLLVGPANGVNLTERWFPSAPQAFNQFRCGPHQTVHDLNGQLATEDIWHIPGWLHVKKSTEFGGDPEIVRTRICDWWSKASNNPLNDLIGSGLRRYCRALDEADTDAALVGLWGCLEELTGTQRCRYDITVDRTCKMFDEEHEKYARQLANHVRLRRNSFMHAARNVGDNERHMVIYHANQLANSALRYCIREGHKFKDDKALFEFLESGTRSPDLGPNE